MVLHRNVISVWLFLFGLSIGICSDDASARGFLEEATEAYFSTPMGFRKILELYEVEEGLPEVTASKTVGRVHPSSGYFIETVELGGEGVSSYKIHIRHPQATKSVRDMPVLFIVAGITSNEATLDLFPRQDGVILVVFEYDLDKSSPLDMIQQLPEAIASTPVQIASSIRWIQAQSWAKREKFNTIAISLGSLFLPLSQRIAQYNGLRIDATVFAYGGADLSVFVESYLAPRIGHKELEITLEILTPLLRPFDPSIHLPLLRSNFLVIHATDDEVIPKAASERLTELAPEPKELVYIQGGHINSDRWDLIEKLGAETMAWLIKIGTLH